MGRNRDFDNMKIRYAQKTCPTKDAVRIVSNKNRTEGTACTNGAYDGSSEPIEMDFDDGIDIPKAVTEYFEGVVGDEHHLNEFNTVDAIDEAFCESSVIRKGQIVQI